MPDRGRPVLEVRGLEATLTGRSGARVQAVRGVDFAVASGECLGVVGESGSGKTVTLLALLGLLPETAHWSGEVRFEGRDLLALPDPVRRRARGAGLGVVFQEPLSALNPVFSIGYQMMEPMRAHLGLTRRAAAARAAELLELVGIPEQGARLGDFPHQFSGGQLQRITIAMALACDPRVLIADEPTTALDVTVQAEILALIRRLRAELGMAVIWVTHDLGVVATLADRVLVMYAGRVIEQATTAELLGDPQHPYTRGLLAAALAPRAPRPRRLRPIPGHPPAVAPARGCSFRPRCAEALAQCAAREPPRIVIGPRRDVACFWDPATGGARDG